MTWQDIATAPRDGRKILVWEKGDICVADFYEEAVGWFSTDELFTGNPTHWQPLPPPPEHEG